MKSYSVIVNILLIFMGLSAFSVGAQQTPANTKYLSTDPSPLPEAPGSIKLNQPLILNKPNLSQYENETPKVLNNVKEQDTAQDKQDNSFNFTTIISKDTTEPPIDNGPRVETINTGELSPPYALGSVGLLSDNNGGFRDDLWHDLTYEDVDLLLGSLPEGGMKSPMWNSILRRMMMTRAFVPAPREVRYASDNAPPTSTGMSILAHRVNWLLYAGYIEDALQLSSLSSDKLQNDLLLRDVTLAYLINGQYADACAFIRMAQSKSISQFWMNAEIICQLRNKDYPGALQTVSLLEEFFALDESLRTQLISSMMGVVEITEPIIVKDPLLILMTAFAGHQVDDKVIEELTPLALQTVLRTNASSSLGRIRALERLVSMGVIPVKELIRAYKEEDLSGDMVVLTSETYAQSTRATVGTTLEESFPTSVEERVRQYQDIFNEEDIYRPTFVLKLVEFWRGAEPKLALQLIKGTLIPTLKVLPVQDVMHVMPDIVRALVVMNRVDAAARWDDTARALFAEGVMDVVPPIRKSRLWFLMVAPATKVSAEDIDIWRQTCDDDKDFKCHKQEEVMLMLLRDLGHEVPKGVWRELVLKNTFVRSEENFLKGSQYEIVTSTWYGLTDSTQDKSVGEAIILAALLGQDNDSDKVSNIILSRQIRVLGILGLVEEARGLAKEIAFIKGL